MSFASSRTAVIRSAKARTLPALIVAASLAAATLPAHSQQAAPTLHGGVRDPLGALVVGASVDLLDGDRVTQTTSTGATGEYSFTLPAAGRYRVRVTASTFEPTSVPAEYLSANANVELDITVATPTLTEQVTVSATGTPTPEAQTGATVTLIPSEDFRYMPEVQDPLRLVPGVQVTQVGQTGGSSGLSIRGGDTDANKVLIDGIPANQIGGGVEFANLASVGVASIEVLNEPNSALYGSDALAGVVNLTSTRASSTPLPRFTYAGDAGNFHTYRNEVTAGTVFRRFDLYSAYARLDTSNNIPNSEFHNGTYAGNFGWAPNASNDLRFTARHINVSGGQPNAVALYGIPDDAQQKEQDIYLAGAWNNQATARWHNLIRYGFVRLNGQFNNFGASICDPITGLCNGAPVTVTGANGYTVSGLPSFPFSSTPSSYLEHNSDTSLYAQTDYRLNPHFIALGAFKFESESGSANDSHATPKPTERGNYSYTLQFSGDLKNRLFYTAGTGLEDNGLFGFAGTPRASLAYYLFRPSSGGVFTGTKLHGTFGKGIKEPSVFQQSYSLFTQLNGSTVPGLINVGPLGAENSRTFDGGLDQQFFNGRLRAGITYFHDEFTNRVEYVPQEELAKLGVPGADSPILAFGGAYINSSAFRSEGIEFTSEMRLSSRFFARGGYTYTDAVVQRSFSSDNAAPSKNTSSNFSDIPIGAFSPLRGARPFRVAPHTGFFALTYSQSKFYGSLTGTLVSRRDDSDFLFDSSFGSSLLLPNRNLDGAYQRLELGGGYQVTPRLNVYTNIQNLLSEHYYEAFGYPALPFTFRSGVKLNFGGESWKLK